MIILIHGSMDNKILKSPKSIYSILDRGALTTKVCGRNRSLLFSLSGRVWYRQIIFGIDFQLDFQDFQWFPRCSNENLGIRGFWYQDIVIILPIIFCQFFFSNASMAVVHYSKVWLKTAPETFLYLRFWISYFQIFHDFVVRWFGINFLGENTISGSVMTSNTPRRYFKILF